MASAQLPHTIERAQMLLLLRLMDRQPWLKKVEDALLDAFDYCDTVDQQNLVADLLLRTEYLSETCFTASIREMGRQVEDGWKLDPKKTWFVSSNHKENTDSSQEVLNRLKSFEWSSADWDRRRFLTRYREVVDKTTKGDTVVIVDDFVGTGRSMTKTVDWFRNKSANDDLDLELRVCVVASCQVGLSALEGLGVDTFSVRQIPKSISDYFGGQDLNNALDAMNALEDKLQDQSEKKLDDYRLGYGASEAMYHRVGGNTPNNVFPFFWWRYVSSGRRTVMHRT
ncbi:phosphoribosyltransferase [Qipengyuania aquimaris]|uniref:Phosphoribosyltransferase domain-containing protein n=1 Tax=Qipengyuania aquimaris TaxID=255984 RepID=A0A9Q3S2S7_9SPHN|nr:phosphoribosyltransferase [Qipengyuania aquimaris]MBY6218775.1 phosphoribosyltransferase domain-containing protein [Qipengyuania aquimaris]